MSVTNVTDPVTVTPRNSGGEITRAYAGSYILVIYSSKYVTWVLDPCNTNIPQLVNPRANLLKTSSRVGRAYREARKDAA